MTMFFYFSTLKRVNGVLIGQWGRFKWDDENEEKKKMILPGARNIDL